MYQTILKDFDIRMLMDSGQVFRIAPCGEDCYTVTAGDHFVCLRCAGHQDGLAKMGLFVRFLAEVLSFIHIILICPWIAAPPKRLIRRIHFTGCCCLWKQYPYSALGISEEQSTQLSDITE